MCLAENDDISKSANIFLKFLFVNVTKLIFKFTFCQVCFKLNKQVRVFQWLPPNPTYLTSKKANFSETATGDVL